MDTSQIAHKLIITLVKMWEKSPSELSEPGFGIDLWDLAAKASIVSKDEAKRRREAYLHGAWDDLPSAQVFMKEKGWISSSDQGVYGKYSKALFPTKDGIEYVKNKSQTSISRFLSLFVKNIYKIVISVIATAIGGLILYIILRYIGWVE